MTDGAAKKQAADRRHEWFVPAFGPLRFRIFVGLLFLPYTGMVISYAVTGSMFADIVHWNRLLALVAIYLLGLGLGAHALDALGSKEGKPWGELFSRTGLWLLAVASLAGAYGIALYYIVNYVPFLSTIALLEGFFVFAYNLEWFKGRFHSDFWFAVSWGFLPVLAGYVMQTGRISWGVTAAGISAALFSIVEIKASRPYKELRRRYPSPDKDQRDLMMRYEAILKGISLGVIFLATGLLIARLTS